MKSEVFFVNASPSGREKKTLDFQVKAALDASLARNPGSRVVALNVAADIISKFHTALVTVIYDDAGKSGK